MSHTLTQSNVPEDAQPTPGPAPSTQQTSTSTGGIRQFEISGWQVETCKFPILNVQQTKTLVRALPSQRLISLSPTPEPSAKILIIPIECCNPFLKKKTPTLTKLFSNGNRIITMTPLFVFGQLHRSTLNPITRDLFWPESLRDQSSAFRFQVSIQHSFSSVASRSD